jgi:plastocyanin
MRRLPLVVALASLGVLATPAAADDATVKIANTAFSPGTVSIHVGEKVTWNWAGPDRNHTVTSDSGQAESFESTPGVPDAAVTDGPPGETFSHTFGQTGSFSYHCRVHSFMQGKVNVVAAGTPLPVDTTPPSTKLKIVGESPVTASRTGRLKVKVTVNEAATEKLAVKLGRKTIARKTVKFSKAQTKTVTLRLSRSARRSLSGRRTARIAVTASATDKAGNKAKTKRKTGTLRSGRKSSPTPSPSPSPYNY